MKAGIDKSDGTKLTFGWVSEKKATTKVLAETDAMDHCLKLYL